MDWTHLAPSSAAFLAQLVEFVEALVVGMVRGWRHALPATALGLLLLDAPVAVLSQRPARPLAHA